MGGQSLTPARIRVLGQEGESGLFEPTLGFHPGPGKSGQPGSRPAAQMDGSSGDN
jgi:hypothetical protein